VLPRQCEENNRNGIEGEGDQPHFQ